MVQSLKVSVPIDLNHIPSVHRGPNAVWADRELLNFTKLVYKLETLAEKIAAEIAAARA